MQGIAVDIQQKFTLEGKGATVPNDPIAKLSYYLLCIGGCVPGVIDEQFTHFYNYSYFSSEKKQAIIILAAILKPSILEGRVIFKTSPSEMEALNPGSTNVFLTLTERTNLTFMDVDQSGAIGLNLNNTEVTRKMLYTEAWLNYYFYTPMKRIQQDLNRLGQQNSRIYVGYDDDNGSNALPLGKFFLAFLIIAFFHIFGVCITCKWLANDLRKHLCTFICCIVLPGLYTSAYLYRTYVEPHVIK